MINDINSEFNRLNNGLAPLHRRHAGTRAAIISSSKHEVTARTIIIENSMIPFHHYLSLYLIKK